MDFIDDEEKMEDFFQLSRYEFSNSYSYLTEEEYSVTLDKIWEELSDIPVNNTGEIIEEKFYIWDKGTSRYDIWHWFDGRVIGGIGKRYFN